MHSEDLVYEGRSQFEGVVVYRINYQMAEARERAWTQERIYASKAGAGKENKETHKGLRD